MKEKTPFFFEIGKDIIKKTHQFLLKYNLKFKRGLILGDEITFKIGGDQIARLLKKYGVLMIKEKVSRSDEATVKKIEKIIKRVRPDLVIGFGGGKVLDVGKLTAGRSKIKFISIPTTLSNDGIASPVSVITNERGIPISHRTRPPYGVIVDLNIIKKAPLRHLRAGVGDLISNLSAVFDCRLAQQKKRDNVKPEILNLAEIGPKRILGCKGKIKSDKFLSLLTDGLIKSGLAMCLSGSSKPASGSEHKISHSMDYLYPGRKALHGEQVGIATIFTMALQKNSYLKSVIKLYRRIKFPQRVSHLGISNKEFVQVVINARKIRPGRYTILEEKKPSPDSIKSIVKAVNL
ncbi:MAG: iron-containing alcohol dehydrogenase [candidate division WOR-3 bacterium]